MLPLKSIPSFFLLLLSVLLISCGEDDLKHDSPSIHGDWKTLSFEGDINSTFELDGNSTVSITAFEASNMNYAINFSEDNYTTNGSYVLTFTTTAQGSTITNLDEFNNVSIAAAFNVTANDILADDDLFDVEFNGLPVTLNGNIVISTYSITNNILTITQSGQVIKTETSGLMSTTDINFISRWQRQ